jgi:hypothetical protein
VLLVAGFMTGLLAIGGRGILLPALYELFGALADRAASRNGRSSSRSRCSDDSQPSFPAQPARTCPAGSAVWMRELCTGC